MGESISELVLAKAAVDGLRPPETYSTPPPEHPDFLTHLGFHSVASTGDLPDGAFFSDGAVLVSLRPAIGQFGWALQGDRVVTLGSFAAVGVQLWGLQMGVPAGSDRASRLADFELLGVTNDARAGNFVRALADARPTRVAPGLVLRGVDLWWHIDALWRASANAWFTWRAAPAQSELAGH